MATKKRSKKRWVQKSVERMKEEGTLGSFGKATPKKISRAIAHGGKMAKKAQWIKNIQKGRKKKQRSSGRS